NRRPRSSFNNGCFAAGTMIRMADKTLKRVEQIEEGDLVYNPVTRSATTVTRTIAGPELDPMYRIATRRGEVLLTAKHPIQTANGLIAVRALKTGDKILGAGGRWDSVTEIEVMTSEEPP